MPFRRCRLSRLVNPLLGRLYLLVLALGWHPHVVLIAYPSLLEFMPRTLSDVPVVYDCMDIATGFAADAGEARRIAGLEERLLRRAAAVVVTSGHLEDLVRSRAPAATVRLVRNGHAGSFGLANARPELEGSGRERLRLGYVGTVAQWFDWALILDALERVPHLELHVWGPVEGRAPAHDRIVLHGSVEHAAIPRVTRSIDAFVMPFRVNPLVEGVDPVKLYEYLELGRPVIAVRYQEIERFDGLVHLYGSAAEFHDLVGRLDGDAAQLAPPGDAARAFLAGSTWRARASEMAEVILRTVGAR